MSPTCKTLFYIMDTALLVGLATYEASHSKEAAALAAGIAVLKGLQGLMTPVPGSETPAQVPAALPGAQSQETGIPIGGLK